MPYFVANGFFIPNRLAGKNETTEWFLLAKNASVTLQSDNMIEIQWPKKAANGYYVPVNITTVEPIERFSDKNGNDLFLPKGKTIKIDLFANPQFRIVYLYEHDDNKKNIISGNNLLNQTKTRKSKCATFLMDQSTVRI